MTKRVSHTVFDSDDPLLPHQFYSLRQAEDVSGERRLCLAILEDAIGVLQSPQVHSAKDWRAAWEWLLDRGIGVWSFAWVCEICNLDPAALRVNLLARARANERVVLPMHRPGHARPVGLRRIK